MSNYAQNLLVILAINACLAFGTFVPMAAGQLNLGVAGFMAIGAYSAAIASNAGVPVAAAIAIGAMTAFSAGFLIAFPILRTRGLFLALATFALGQVIQAAALNLSITGGAAGLPVTSRLGPTAVVGVSAILCLGVAYLMSTHVGTVFRLLKSDRLVAESFGVNARFYEAAALATGALLAGTAGALHAHYFSYLEVQHFGVALSISILLFVLLGGTASAWGPFAGAAIYTLLPELLRVGASWRYVIVGSLVIAIMMIRPQGVVSRLRRKGGRGKLVAAAFQTK